MSRRYLWVSPSALTIFLVASLCFSYTQRQDEYTWLAHLIDYLKGVGLDNINSFSHEDLRQSVRDRGLLSYGLMAALYLGACVIACGVGLYAIKGSSQGKPWFSRAMILFSIALAVGIAFYLFQNPPYSSRCNQNDIWSQLVCKTIADNWIIGSRNIGARVVSWHLWLDAVGVTIATFFALITSVILRSALEPNNETTYLKEQIRYLRIMLYVGSALLIIATLRLSTILHWTLDYLQPHPSMADNKEVSFLINNLNGFISNVVTSMGAFYTLLLIVIFVPAALILNNSTKESGEIVSPLSEQLLRLAAIVGPLLAGPIGELLNLLK